MITPYLSQQPVDDFGLRFADLKYSAVLPMAVDTTLTIPGNSQRYKAVIKTFPAGGVLYVSLNVPAVLPVAPVGGSLSVSTVESVEVTALCREVKAGDILHFIASGDGTPVSVVLYALGTNN